MKPEQEQEGIRLAAVFHRKVMDFDNLQNEIVKRNVRRISRFLGRDRQGGANGKERDAERDHILSALQVLLQNDPEYAALYQGTMDALTEVERATEVVLERIMERQQAAEEVLADVRENALTLDDGRRVYRNAGGALRFEDGSAIDFDDNAIAVQWHRGMPGYEKLVANRDTAQSESDTINEIMHYQVNMLGAARDRMKDGDAPFDVDELGRLSY